MPAPASTPAPVRVQRSEPTERLLGPLRGYYLASYALESEDGFYAYCKVCADRPDSYWTATARWKYSSRVAFSSPQAALQEAERLALARIKGLLKPAAGSRDTG